MGEGPVGPAGEDLFGLGVAPVVFPGLDEREPRIGEQGVVAPGGEQLTLAGLNAHYTPAALAAEFARLRAAAD